MDRLCIHGRDIGKRFTTGLLKVAPVLLIDFLYRLQAVCGEAGTEDLYRFHSLPGQGFQGGIRVGLQPFFPPEARLERRHPLIIRKPQCFSQ